MWSTWRGGWDGVLECGSGIYDKNIIFYPKLMENSLSSLGKLENLEDSAFAPSSPRLFTL
jgi:hypothetical protein